MKFLGKDVIVVFDEFQETNDFFSSKSKIVPKKKRAYGLKEKKMIKKDPKKKITSQHIRRMKFIDLSAQDRREKANSIIRSQQSDSTGEKESTLILVSDEKNYTSFLNSLSYTDLMEHHFSRKRLICFGSVEIFVTEVHQTFGPSSFGDIIEFHLSDGRKLKRLINEEARVCEKKELPSIST